MEFFTSPRDLTIWVQAQGSPDKAAQMIMDVIGSEEEQDIIDTCRSMFDDKSIHTAAQVLFGLLARHNLTMTKESDSGVKMKKEAQSQRTGLYNNLPLRVCPKLPKRSNVISTWNCREHCLDSATLDEDPNRVICLEALWRRHVMDKFSRDWKDKDGKLVGGYINDRFQVYNDDGGNPMELANGERTRQPRPHQYSTERRLEEARGEETKSIMASSQKMTRLASDMPIEDDDQVFSIFSDILEMKEAGLKDIDILSKISSHYNVSVPTVAMIDKYAEKQYNRHKDQVYAYNNSKLHKTAQNLPGGVTMTSTQDVNVIPTGGNQVVPLQPGTNVVQLQDESFQIVDGQDAGKQFSLANIGDAIAFESIDNGVDQQTETIQQGADDVMLNEEVGKIGAEPSTPEVTPEVPSEEQNQQTEATASFPIIDA